MPGCTCEKEIFLIAYNDETTEVKATNPDWTPHQVRLSVAQILQSRFKADMAAAKMEASDTQAYEVNDEFSMINGRAHWTKYDRDMNELEVRTSELTPHQYVTSDGTTTATIETALRQGAKMIVTSYAREGDNNRDLLVITYDPETNRGRMKVINVAATGQQQNFENMQSVAKNQFSNLMLHRPSDTTFLLSDVRISNDQLPNATSHPQRLELAANRIHVAQEKHVVIPEMNIEVKPRWDAMTQTVWERNTSILAEKITRNKIRKDYIRDQPQVSRIERLTLEKIREKPVSLGHVVEKHHIQMQQRVKELQFIAETRVAMGAAPLILLALREKPPSLVASVEKSMRRHEKKVRKVRKVREVRKAKNAREHFIKAAPVTIERIEPIKTGKNEKQKRKLLVRGSGGEVVSVRRKENITKQKRGKVHMEHPTGSRTYTIRERSRRMERRKKNRGLEKSVDKKAIAEKLTHFTGEKQEKRRKQRGLKSATTNTTNTRELKLATPLTPVKEQRRRQRRELASQEVVLRSRENRSERSVLRRVRFAWLLYRRLHLAKTQGVTFKNRGSPEERRDSSKRFATDSGSPWILLSIVWHLTALREGGRGYQASPQRRRFPKQAVIFAFQ